MTLVISATELPGHTARQFEGYKYDDTGVSFFINHTPPGKGVDLHRHPYPEVFIVHEGQLTFTVGADTVEAGAGQIVIVPTDTPHKFINGGSVVARHVDVHVSPRMITTWLE